MNVLPTIPESKTLPTSAPADLPQQKTSLSDFFQELISSVTSKSDIPHKEITTDKKIVSDSKKMAEDLSVDNSQLIAQLNITEVKANPINEIKTGTSDTSDKPKATKNITIPNKTTQFQLQQPTQLQQPKQLQPNLKTMTTTSQNQSVTTDETIINNKENTGSTKNKDIATNNVLNNFLQVNATKVTTLDKTPEIDPKTLPNVMMNTALDKNVTPNPSQPLDKPMKKISNVEVQQPAIKSDITTQEAVPVAPLVNTNTSQHDDVQNKYFQLMTQLGNNINSQTAGTNTLAAQTMSQNIKSAEQIPVASESQHTDYQFNVEMMPQTQESLAKQTYDAKIKIYPPELGSVTASLKMDKDGANLVIMTQSDHVKAIVESNLTQLRQNFQQADINLTSIQVQTSQSSNKDMGGQNQGSNTAFGSLKTNDDPDKMPSINNKASKNPDSIVDTYA